MANITKDQWKKLEEEMTYSFVSIRFKYQGYELSVQRIRTAENKTELCVYIDDVYKSSWGNPDREDGDAPDIIKEVWRKRSIAMHKPSTIQKLIKKHGKRRVHNAIPDWDARIEYYEPFFPKASVLCRQFKKLEDLELIEGCHEQP
ncbi:hypothetical protein [Vibrio sp. LaRot3]|uniref:hypothetical protein n=1 Tax=Vibrio sp. LaRot3 TaxID=2998829 RepID=UPI0022CE0498|nr:hypothetical protein [Vibrio sp. LaRot3]MDA0148832.1 hypothetical protein [Vibrio sp. LaRot3]